MKQFIVFSLMMLLFAALPAAPTLPQAHSPNAEMVAVAPSQTILTPSFYFSEMNPQGIHINTYTGLVTINKSEFDSEDGSYIADINDDVKSHVRLFHISKVSFHFEGIDMRPSPSDRSSGSLELKINDAFFFKVLGSNFSNPEYAFTINGAAIADILEFQDRLYLWGWD